MDEQAFHLLYNETAHSLRAYLRYKLGDSALADDLLQESYMRFLMANLPEEMLPAHQKNYLYKIATNLIRDSRRGRKYETISDVEILSSDNSVDCSLTVQSAFRHLKPKERDLLWLAYVEGFSHAEISTIVRAKTASIRPMLARARSRLARLLSGNKVPLEEQNTIGKNK